MKYHSLRPDPSLSNHIANYFFMHVEEAGTADELVIPDGTHGLMFVQQAQFTRHDYFGETEVSGSYLFGQKSKPVHYGFDTPGLLCFGIKFQPHGLKRFTTMPMSEIQDSMVAASTVLGKDFVVLEEKVLSSNGHQEKKRLLDAYFIQILRQEVEPDHLLVQQVLKEIHRLRGQLEITYLMQLFGLGYKRLERLFKKQVGLGPKAYCRIVRFNATLFYQTQQPADNLTALAYTAGYFDQMHFVKEVKHFTNLTPKAFFNQGLGELGMQQRALVMERMGN